MIPIDDSLPDPDSLEAFICKGNQAVTYGAGEYFKIDTDELKY